MWQLFQGHLDLLGLFSLLAAASPSNTSPVLLGIWCCLQELYYPIQSKGIGVKATTVPKHCARQ